MKFYILFIFIAYNAIAFEPTDLNEFFSLKERLSQAICDENVLLKLPSLDVLRKETKLPPYAMIRFDIPEEKAIRVLLGMTNEVLGSQYYVEQSHKSVKPPDNIKKQLSLEICTALLSSERLRELFWISPSRFFQGSFLSFAELVGIFGKSSPGTLVLEDIESRYAKIGAHAWIAGWIEPLEWFGVFYKNKSYLRLRHPILEQTLSVVVLSAKGYPLGYVYQSFDPLLSNFAQLKTKSISFVNQQKKIDVYRVLLEREAYFANKADQSHADKIKLVLNDFKNTLQTYLIGIEKGETIKPARRSLFRKDYLAVFNSDFFKMLGELRKRGFLVSVQLFDYDPKLHQIYLSALTKLHAY
ncbi:MAG: hypothetical protein HY843_00880 [Bdellovibrio sp.]|nr:hypothetical protein [Bdellovibrio sp.]